MTDFERQLVNKIDNGEELSNDELREFLWECGATVSTTYGENRRWSRSVQTVNQIGDRFFAIDWEQGLTERQEDEVWEQPYEVERHEREITKIEVEWIAKT